MCLFGSFWWRSFPQLKHGTTRYYHEFLEVDDLVALPAGLYVLLFIGELITFALFICRRDMDILKVEHIALTATKWIWLAYL